MAGEAAGATNPAPPRVAAIIILETAEAGAGGVGGRGGEGGGGEGSGRGVAVGEGVGLVQGGEVASEKVHYDFFYRADSQEFLGQLGHGARRARDQLKSSLSPQESDTLLLRLPRVVHICTPGKVHYHGFTVPLLLRKGGRDAPAVLLPFPSFTPAHPNQSQSVPFFHATAPEWPPP